MSEWEAKRGIGREAGGPSGPSEVGASWVRIPNSPVFKTSWLALVAREQNIFVHSNILHKKKKTSREYELKIGDSSPGPIAARSR